MSLKNKEHGLGLLVFLCAMKSQGFKGRQHVKMSRGCDFNNNVKREDTIYECQFVPSRVPLSVL